MNITVNQTTISGELTQTVNARTLHESLGVKKQFTNWVKAQIGRARLLEGRDFLTVAQKGYGEPAQAKRDSRGQFVEALEYHLTIDAAKHVAMMSHTERGFEVREYFIKVEKAYVAAQIARANPLGGLKLGNFLYLGDHKNPSIQRIYLAVQEASALGVYQAARTYALDVGLIERWMKIPIADIADLRDRQPTTEEIVRNESRAPRLTHHA